MSKGALLDEYELRAPGRPYVPLSVPQDDCGETWRSEQVESSTPLYVLPYTSSYDFCGENQGCQIESYFLIESKVFADIKSNRMQIESNEIFDFRYDSIRSGQKGEQEKPWTEIVENEELYDNELLWWR